MSTALIPEPLEANPIAWLGSIREEIQACEDTAQLSEMSDQAAAMRTYLTQKLGKSSEQARAVAEAEVLVSKRLGELLPRKQGTRSDLTSPNLGEVREVVPSQRAAEFRKLADAPLDDYLARCREQEKPPSVSGALKFAKLAAVQEDAKATAPLAIADLHDLAAQVKAGEFAPFGTVYADPPWQYSNQGTRGCTNNHYGTMPSDDIAALPVADLVAENAHLHLWTTNVFLGDALRILDAWGFRFVSMLVWVKKRLDVVDGAPRLAGRLGMGNYWRVDHELMLLGVRGSCPFAEHNRSSVLVEPPTRHSAKPASVLHTVTAMSPAPRLEMFARETFPGWTSWGNQVERGLFNANELPEGVEGTTEVPRCEVLK